MESLVYPGSGHDSLYICYTFDCFTCFIAFLWTYLEEVKCLINNNCCRCSMLTYLTVLNVSPLMWWWTVILLDKHQRPLIHSTLCIWLVSKATFSTGNCYGVKQEVACQQWAPWHCVKLWYGFGDCPKLQDCVEFTGIGRIVNLRYLNSCRWSVQSLSDEENLLLLKLKPF